MVELLEAAVAEMHDRAASFGGKTRTFTVSVAFPFLVVLIDELAFLTAYQPERDLRKRAEAAIATLTRQGRSVGVCVVGALQDPRKDVINLRNLFPTRIAMRLDESDQVDMVLGDGARDRGALADLISRCPRSAPGWPMSGWKPPPTRCGSAPPTSPTPTSTRWPRCVARAVRPRERAHLAHRRTVPAVRHQPVPARRPRQPARRMPPVRLPRDPGQRRHGGLDGDD